jgi:serine/threonine protein kinase
LVSAVVVIHQPTDGFLVIHRDIKTENVLIKIIENGKPIVKLADFGCAIKIKFGERIEGVAGTISKLLII